VLEGFVSVWATGLPALVFVVALAVAFRSITEDFNR